MELLTETIFQFAIVISIFLVLTIIGEYAYKLKNKYGKSIDVNELLPEDEIHSLRQVFYLILMALCVVDIFYTFIGDGIEFLYSFPIFDIALSLYFAIKIDKSSMKNKIIWLLLVPYGTLCFLLFHTHLVIYMGLIHVLVFIYFAKLSFDKFMEYTNSNGLGITIILLFVIIFASFFITQHAEGVNALDSLVMISNEFTGNGFAVFGNSIAGKLNSLLLVWGGYVISGASAATLTAAILIKHFKKRFAELEKLIEGEDE
ncbi:hypothetical protein [Methanosphaera sp. BMS]|uniref:hypothetical protein n=1 Tax=Methanosphaera sp. BMS TaxID=1789762 RepID=UPI000DC1D83D|nr:hypothetical protein [Methanosphaera sp. BMS]AWX32899.1 hypothetical protein AW729_07205 [Methanosphaera sp. BMS]